MTTPASEIISVTAEQLRDALTQAFNDGYNRAEGKWHDGTQFHDYMETKRYEDVTDIIAGFRGHPDSRLTTSESIGRTITRMREQAEHWRRPSLRQVEGPNDLKIYGETIADEIDEWADLLATLSTASKPEPDTAAVFAANDAPDVPGNADGKVATLDIREERVDFVKWWKNWCPDREVPEATSHIFDAWLGSARHRRVVGPTGAEELRALLKAATPGEWSLDGINGDIVAGPFNVAILYACKPEDRALMVACVNHIRITLSGGPEE